MQTGCFLNIIVIYLIVKLTCTVDVNILRKLRRNKKMNRKLTFQQLRWPIYWAWRNSDGTITYFIQYNQPHQRNNN
jgi:hypothetical protein